LCTGVAWGAFGLVAGVLYGTWAGQAVTAGRLKSTVVSRVLAPGTSMVLAWVDGPLSQATLEPFTAPGSQHLVLRFKPVHGGAVLDAN
jgi:hypothetical protein